MRGFWSLRFVVLAVAIPLGFLYASQTAASPLDDDSEFSVQQPSVDDVWVTQREAPARLSRLDDAVDSERSAPGFRNEVQELTYRWWLSSGRADYGIGIGTRSHVMRPMAPMVSWGAGAGPATVSTTAILSMGLRYQASAAALVYADAASGSIHDFGSTDGLTTKVGFQLKTAQSLWNISYSGLGFRLAGDMRMSLRVRRGGAFNITLRQTF